MPMVSSNFVVPNKYGMHARPAALFAKTAGRYEADIRVKNGSGFVDGKSVINLLAMGAEKGARLTVVADGRDARKAMEEITFLFAASFGEK